MNYLILLLLTFVQRATGYIWSTRIDGSGSDTAFGVAIDSDGNVFVVGCYESSPVSIYQAGSTSAVATLSNAGGTSSWAAFIVKYSSTGSYLWSTRIDGSGYDEANSVAIDADGNVVVVGLYQSLPVSIYQSGSTSAVATLTNDGGTNPSAAFIVKYSSSGSYLWSTRVDGSDQDSANGVAIDEDGNVVVVGSYRSLPVSIYEFGTSTAAATLSNAGGTSPYASFIVKYSSTGSYLWSTRIDGSGSDIAEGVAIDAVGNVVFVGRFS